MKTKVWGILPIVFLIFLLFPLTVYLFRHRRAEKAPEVRANAPAYVVYKADQEVLKVQDSPGCLVSRAYPPRGRTFPRHPFVNAQSLDAFEEDALRKILDRSHDFPDFVSLLKKNGYRVEAAR